MVLDEKLKALKLYTTSDSFERINNFVCGTETKEQFLTPYAMKRTLIRTLEIAELFVPISDKLTLYRGLGKNEFSKLTQFRAGEKFQLTSFISTSRKADVAHYMGYVDKNNLKFEPSIIEILPSENASIIDVNQILGDETRYPNEMEVILKPSEFVITDISTKTCVERYGIGYTNISVKQVRELDIRKIVVESLKKFNQSILIENMKL